MPRIESFTDGMPSWPELFTTDKKKAMEFYGPLFGWTEREGGEDLGFYSTLFKGDDIVAGMNQKGAEAQAIPDMWTVYFQSSDATATAALAQDAGGQIYMAPMPVADLGSMCLIADPTGAAVGLWQPGTHKGYAIWGEPGAPMWFELMTHDLDAAKPFYATIFGNPVVDQEMAPGEPGYATIRVNNEAVAGLMGAGSWLPADVPAHWRVYFGVEDCRAAVKQVQQLGGAVLTDPTDSPFGTVATVADPFGATFVILST